MGARLQVVLVADDQHQAQQHTDRAQVPRARLLAQHRKRQQRAHERLQALEARDLHARARAVSGGALAGGQQRLPRGTGGSSDLAPGATSWPPGRAPRAEAVPHTRGPHLAAADVLK